MSARFAEKEFLEAVRLNPYWSSFICFAETVKGRGVSKRVIRRAFDRMVDKDDYAKADRNGIINFLNQISRSSA